MNEVTTRAILFDLVGVLFSPNGTGSADKVLDWFDGMIGRCRDDAGLKAELLERFPSAETKFEQLLVRIVDRYVPFQPVWALLPHLKLRYHLGIINNGTGLTLPIFAERYGLLENFEVIISSGREGACKPEPQIYRLAMQRLSLAADRCLFMDDSLENVLAADALGMQTIHWPDPQTGLGRFQEWLGSEVG